MNYFLFLDKKAPFLGVMQHLELLTSLCLKKYRVQN